MDLQKVVPLIARIFLALIFVRSGVGKALDFAGTQEQIAGVGLPLPVLLTVGAIAFELIGAALVLLGYKAKWGALLLILFLIPTTLIFHSNFADGMQVTQFLKNLAILGGLLMVIAFGSGPLSLDSRTHSRRRF